MISTTRPVFIALSIFAISAVSVDLIVAVEDADRYDVVVYGGTSAGVVAAVQAERMGKRAVLIEPSRHLGGLSSGGLGSTDTGRSEAIGGLGREFYRRIKKHYDDEANWTRADRDDYRFYRPGDDAMWRFEPAVAERVFQEMIEEAGVVVALGQRLDREDGVRKENGRIASITMEGGRVFTGEVFLDTSYEGDLMAAAGVSYTVGRESNDQYGETLNGVQKEITDKRVGEFVEPVDPYVVPGDPSSGLLPHVHDEDPGRDGEADHRVQAYCFRMCLTDVPENRAPFPRPEGYDPLRYELMLRYFETGQKLLPWNNSVMPNRKTDTNNHGFVMMSTDYIGGNYDYPEADYETRERIVADHEGYQKGLMWTLANHPRVPEDVRGEINQWGLAKDEFEENGNWPHQLYVREARRMVGRYVMTEQDCRRTRQTPDPVGLGSYALDSHHVQRYVTESGHARNEGNTYGSTGGPYPIAYGSITPRAEECTNLLVPACLSASHVAYGSIRMEPVFMVLGQSAGTAAVLAIEAGIAVQEVDYEKLRERLLADGQTLVPPAGRASRGRTRRMPAAEDLDGIVVDDAEATFTGEWKANDMTGPFVGAGYRHDRNAGKGRKSVRFEADLPRSGRYEVRLSYSVLSNRATGVPVAVHHADSTDKRRVDQRAKPEHDGLFTTLGTYRFEADRPAAVIVGNAETDGHVIVDAVQFLWVED
ncbi:MAG: FAD-dependent oxidoreductase [Verrucomicrobiales bacterium]